VLLIAASVHSLDKQRVTLLPVPPESGPGAPMAPAASLDVALLRMLEKNSFWQLSIAAAQQAPLVVDLQLADSTHNFFPAVYDYLKQEEKAAAAQVAYRDVYGLQARITIVPGHGTLPMSGGSLMLLPVWSQQLSGSSLIFSISMHNRDDRADFIREVVRVVDSWARVEKLRAGESRPHHHLYDLELSSEEAAAAEVVWRAGVSHSTESP